MRPAVDVATGAGCSIISSFEKLPPFAICWVLLSSKIKCPGLHWLLPMASGWIGSSSNEWWLDVTVFKLSLHWQSICVDWSLHVLRMPWGAVFLWQQVMAVFRQDRLLLWRNALLKWARYCYGFKAGGWIWRIVSPCHRPQGKLAVIACYCSIEPTPVLLTDVLWIHLCHAFKLLDRCWYVVLNSTIVLLSTMFVEIFVVYLFKTRRIVLCVINGVLYGISVLFLCSASFG